MHVEMRNIADIKPYPHNPRHNDHAVDAVAASIREFGFRQPLVVDEDGVIVVGDTRYKAALKLGLDEVPVHVATGLTPAQFKAYRIADNKTAEIADWDYELLVQEIARAPAGGLRPRPAGLLAQTSCRTCLHSEATAGLTDPDDVPAPPDEPDHAAGRPVAARGAPPALRRLHASRRTSIGCSDGAPVHLVNTDPPYNVQGRAAQQQRHCRRPQLVPRATARTRSSTSSATRRSPSNHEEAAGQGPSAGQRLRDRPAVRPAVARLVRQHGPRAAARARFLYLGRVCQLRQLPARAQGQRLVLLARRSSGSRSIRC